MLSKVRGLAVRSASRTRWLTARRTFPVVLAVAAAIAVTAALPARSLDAAATTSDDWTAFHHDAMHTGVSTDTTIGAAHAPALKELWSRLVGGGSQGKAAVDGSPLIAYNPTLAKTVIYAVSVLGQVHAFDTSGNTIFSVSVDSPTFNGAVVDTPALYNGTLYFGTTHGILYALNATNGSVVCSYQLPIVSPETTPGQIEASPAVAVVDGTGPVVFFGDSGQTEKVNFGWEWAINGVGNTNGQCTLKWQFNNWANKGITGTKTGSWSPPAVGKDKNGNPLVLFGSSNPDDSLYAVNAITGTEVWHQATQQTGGDQDVGAGPTISAPGVNGNADGVAYVDGKDKIEYAFDLTTGAPLWNYNMFANSTIQSNSVSCAALVGNDLVIGYSGYVYNFNATTGALNWRTATAVGTILASVSISGAPGDQVVMVGDLSFSEHAYALSNGAPLWSLNVLHKIHASTAVSDGMAVFASDGGYVYAVG